MGSLEGVNTGFGEFDVNRGCPIGDDLVGTQTLEYVLRSARLPFCCVVSCKGIKIVLSAAHGLLSKGWCRISLIVATYDKGKPCSEREGAC